MGRYRKRPVEVDAIQFTGDNALAIMLGWMGRVAEMRTDRDTLWISTPEGEMMASPGDWIIRGTKGEFYPCKPDIFEEIYEEVLISEGLKREGWGPV